MNIFRLLGDLSHLLAIIILLLKIWKTRSCAGISGRSQILFAITYTARYLDLITAYISAYNTIMKLVFIVASYATLYLMYVKFKATYDRNHDSFKVEFLLLPCVGLALLINHEFSVMEILWTFSIYLESVAILPQLFLVSKTGEAESITSHYLFALGSYRALYVLNWIYRYYAENHYDLIAIVAGVVQTVLYCDFFYLYITKDNGFLVGNSDATLETNLRELVELTKKRMNNDMSSLEEKPKPLTIIHMPVETKCNMDRNLAIYGQTNLPALTGCDGEQTNRIMQQSHLQDLEERYLSILQGKSRKDYQRMCSPQGESTTQYRPLQNHSNGYFHFISGVTRTMSVGRMLLTSSTYARSVGENDVKHGTEVRDSKLENSKNEIGDDEKLLLDDSESNNSEGEETIAASIKESQDLK